MNKCMMDSSHCWIAGIAMGLVWWLVASGLLTLTWNKVIGSVAKAKPVKYWQALLFVATLCALCAPRAMMKRGGHSCCNSSSCETSHTHTDDADSAATKKAK